MVAKTTTSNKSSTSVSAGGGRDYASTPISKSIPAQPSISTKDSSGDRIVRIATGNQPNYIPEPISGLQQALNAYSKYSPAGIFFNSEFMNTIKDASKTFQNKAIAFDLQNKLKNQYKQDLASGGVAPGAAQTQLSKDLIAARAGQFSQQQYQDRYAPQMNQIMNNINTSSNAGNSSMNNITPFAPYIISGTAPLNSSIAANWYSNLGNTNFGNTNTNINTEYSNAQTAIKNKLTNTGPLGQIAIQNSPFFDWLKNNNLNRGIL